MEANIQKIIRTNWNVTICVSKIARFSSDYSDRGHFYDKYTFSHKVRITAGSLFRNLLKISFNIQYCNITNPPVSGTFPYPVLS